jgi:hypothetical protein
MAHWLSVTSHDIMFNDGCDTFYGIMEIMLLLGLLLLLLLWI